MPHQTCSVCRHVQLAEIDQALLSGASLRAVAKQFELSKAAVDRHRNHGKRAKTLVNIGDFARIDAEIRKLHCAQTAARKRKDNTVALQIARELRNWFTLRVKARVAAAGSQTQEHEQLTRVEAIALSRALIESEVNSGNVEILEWLHALVARVANATPIEPTIVAGEEESSTEA